MYQNDKNWMKVALKYAQHAQDIGEIPVGAVLISKQNIIGIGWNNSINQNDPTAHAEIMAIRYAGKNIKNYRLIQTTLYVTLQPCIMCFGAIIHSRIKRLVFGAKNKSITRTSVPKNIFLNAKKNHNIEIKTNIMKSECSEILIKFFQNKRKK